MSNIKKYEIDALVAQKKNVDKISFSWGFEYRFLGELSGILSQKLCEKYKLNLNRFFFFRYPSISSYLKLSKLFNIKKTIRITKEIIGIEGNPKSKYIMNLPGTLAYLLPGQSYLEGLSNLKKDWIPTEEDSLLYYEKRKILHGKITTKLSKKLCVPSDKLFLNWGSGGSIELILYLIHNSCKHKPQMLINVPNYFYTYSLAEKFGYNIKSILSYKGRDFSFPYKSIKKELLKNNYDLVVFTTPNNPFGAEIPIEQLYDLLVNLPEKTYGLVDMTGLSRHDLFPFRKILSDEAITKKNIFFLDSLSKKYEMCHVRAGIVVLSNNEMVNRLPITEYSPILNEYSYEKINQAIDNPSLSKEIIEKHQRYFTLLKSTETNSFIIQSDHFSNFIVARMKSKNDVKKFINQLSSKYNYYDLPFYGIGKYKKGSSNINQDFIQYLPQNCLRLLEETTNYIMHL